MVAQNSRQWTLEMQLHCPEIPDVALSPDGGQVVFSLKQPLLTDTESRFVTHLYRLDTHGGAADRLTFGEHSNSQPQWSPDGAYLAFLSDRHEGVNNLYVLRAAGGEARALTRFDKNDILRFRWAPDGTAVAFSRVPPPGEARQKAVEAKDDSLRWDVDHEFADLFRLPFAADQGEPAEPVALTTGRFHVVAFDWFPDGARLALSHMPTPLDDAWSETRLSAVPAFPEGPADLATFQDLGLVSAYDQEVRVSPDGQWVACVTGALPPRWAGLSRVSLFPAGGGEPRHLAYGPDELAVLVGWAADGQAVYTLELMGLDSQFLAVPVDGSPVRPLTTSAQIKLARDANAADDIAYVAESFHQPPTIYLLEAGAADAHPIYTAPLPEAWPEPPWPRAEVIRWLAPDGVPVQGVVYYPDDYQPGEPYPLIVEVHGGPAGVFSRRFVANPFRYGNVVALTERGFLVLRANPRGSSGYGQAFRFANYQDWGQGDYQDIMAGVDWLVAQGVADPARLGIMGWSYGGYMTSWVITQTDRFRAACVGAGVTNPLSFNGTTDIPGFIPDYFGAEFWHDLARYARHSPLLQARTVTTPTLIQHGAEDRRVPVSQGKELYNALKRQGVPVEMVIYPREPHTIEEPRHRIDLHRRVVAWFDRWVRDVSDEAT